MASTVAAAGGTTQAQVDELILDLLPAQGEWDEEAYLWLTDSTNRLLELADGYIEVLAMPTEEHQTVLQELFLAFLGVVKPLGGVVHFAPLRLHIRKRVFREPDMLLLLKKDDPRRANRYWSGADLVVEVVSADKPERDLVEKRRDYAEARVPEYWIVNPLNQTITVLMLTAKGQYAEHGVFARGTRATSVLLAGFTVDVTALFDAD